VRWLGLRKGGREEGKEGGREGGREEGRKEPRTSWYQPMLFMSSQEMMAAMCTLGPSLPMERPAPAASISPRALATRVRVRKCSSASSITSCQGGGKRGGKERGGDM
jgi:hypothetical protein